MVATKARGRPPHDDVLTPAEWRVVHAVRHGLTNRQIAERRGISLEGVKYHVANAIAKLGIENRKALRRWVGAPKGSPLNLETQQMNETLDVLGVGQISRSVNDVGRAEAWYRDVLGLTHLYTFEKLAFFDCGGTRLMLTEQETLQPAESILYFRVGDIGTSYEELKRRGVECISAPHMIHRHEDGSEEWMAFFNDLESRPLALMTSVFA